MSLATFRQRAADLITKRFEQNPDPRCNLPYHSLRHTMGVVKRATAIAKVFQAERIFTGRHVGVVEIAAYGHDLVQNFEFDPHESTIGLCRVRRVGNNEAASVRETIQLADESGLEITAFEGGLIREAIMTTIPTWDPVHQTVIQTALNSSSPYITVCLALADIGDAGMDATEFIEMSDALIQENWLVPYSAVSDTASLTLLRNELVAWNYRQVKFAEGRKSLLESELECVPTLVRDAVRALFSQFDTSINTMQERANHIARMPSRVAVSSMGFPNMR